MSQGLQNNLDGSNVPLQGTPLVAIQVVVPTSAATYSANNVVGGVQTLAGAARVAGGKAVLESVAVIDAATQGAQLTLLFFKGKPTLGTYTDAGALTLNAADLPNYIGKVDLTAASYDPAGSADKVNSLGDIMLELTGDAAGNVYVVATTTGTPTYTASCLTVTYGINQG
jgi:hypothetical protein